LIHTPLSISKNYISQLTKINHLGDIEYYNPEFQVLATRVDDTSDQYLLESYMGGLKEDIKKYILLRNYANIMEDMQFSRHIQANNKAIHKSSIVAYIGIIYPFGFHKKNIPQPTRLTPQQMDERREK
jgi:hypothetical protein